MLTQIRMQRREAILHAAKREFTSQGYERAKIENIAREAGIGKSTVYEYFPSKKDLLVNVIDVVLQFLMQQCESVMREEMPFREKLIYLFHSRPEAETHWQLENLSKLMMMCDGSPATEYIRNRSREFHEFVVDKMTDAAKKAIACGELRKDLDCMLIANVVFLFAVATGARLDSEKQRDQFAKGAIDMIYQGIGKMS